jgi:arylsulfatase A-like enzyme
MKKLFWPAITLAGAALAALVFVSLQRETARPVPSLLGRPLSFKTAPVEKAWKEISARQELALVYFRERVNRYFPQQAVECRVKHGNASYQALLAPKDSRIEFEIKAAAGDQLSFALFTHRPGTLTFLVKALVSGEKEQLLFRHQPSEPLSTVKRISLEKFAKKRVRLVLETGGSGLGAWIDPCLLSFPSRPRTVLIVVFDTLRADHVSAYGYSRRTTPALDGLAKDSMLYTRAFSPSSWTLPAHVSLFSGRDVLGHGVIAPESVIPADLPLLAEKMQADGYITVALTGGGFVDDHFGFSRGFQTYASRPDDIYQQRASEFLCRAFLARAADLAGQDLFIFLHTYQMHAPYKAPEPFHQAFRPGAEARIKHVAGNLRRPRGSTPVLPPAEEAERQKIIDLYDGSILYSDQKLLQPVLDYLRASGRYDDALLVVLADHGEEFFDHGDWEHGHSLYQELIRIPLVVKMPRQRRGEVRSGLFSLSQVAGLIQETCAVKVADGKEGSGPTRSLQPPLELSLPVIPLRAGLNPKVSYVAADHQYIHNFYDPRAGAGRDEWFALADSPTASVLPFSPSPSLFAGYKKMLAGYLRRLRALKGTRSQLDPELQQKLKALGYLNN